MFIMLSLTSSRIEQSALTQLIVAFSDHKYLLVFLQLSTFLLIFFVSFA